jgi:hypothetical protein
MLSLLQPAVEEEVAEVEAEEVLLQKKITKLKQFRRRHA